MFKYGDRVVVTSDKYSCADVGDTGTIVDSGTPSSVYYGMTRYLIRFDKGEGILYGIYPHMMAKLV